MKSRKMPLLLTLALACALLLVIGSSGYAAPTVPLASHSSPSLALATGSSPNQPAVVEPPAWHNPYPNYSAIKMTSATNGWIVGEGGVIKHYYNGWGDYPSPVTSTLSAVDVVGSDGWVVGANNTILQLVGTDWHVASSPAPPTTTLKDVKIVAPGEAWAIGNHIIYTDPDGYQSGDANFILHYSAGSWQLVAAPAIPAGATLNQMSWVSPTDGWIVGSENLSPYAYHYTAGTWTRVALPSPDLSFATSVFMRNSSDGWAGLFDEDTYNVSIFHYNGSGWQLAATYPRQDTHRAPSRHMPQPKGGGGGEASAVFSLLSFSAGDYFASGFAYLDCLSSCGPVGNFYSNFLDHNQTTVGSGDNLLKSISGSGPTDIWGVGVGGSIYHWDGSSLTANVHGLSGTQVQMLNPNDGWLRYGSYYNPGSLYHYDGNSWAATILTNVHTFAFDSASDGWAALYGSGRATSFTHYNGTSWQGGQALLGTVNAMQMLTITEGWGVGSDAGSRPSAYHFSSGSWVTASVDSSVNGYLNALSFDSTADGWAVGTGNNNSVTFPLVYHYSGGSWISATLPTSDTIPWTVWAVAPNDVWVGGYSANYGSSSTLWHWDGSHWNGQSVPLSIYSIQMLSPSEGWAGGSGPLLHYTGGSWQVAYDPGTLISSLSFDSASDGWAVAQDSLLHYYPACYDYYYDVGAGNFAAAAVFYLSCQGIVSGTGNHIFSPNAPATRIQFAKMISLARGWALTTPGAPTFSDVPPSNPLYTFVETAYANGAISGATQDACAGRGLAYPCFLPNDDISRAATAVITVRAFSWPIDSTGGPHFSDVPTTNYAYGAVETCYNRGIVNGIGGGLFAPNANVTRAQLAVILYKALTLP